jgi:membrane-bound lytic murein transglycosylase A
MAHLGDRPEAARVPVPVTMRMSVSVVSAAVLAICLACAVAGCAAPADRPAVATRGSTDRAPGASRRAGDATLHPPADGVESQLREVVVAWPEALPLETIFPKRDLEQRMAFIAACDMSMRARDRDAVDDAKALAALYAEFTDPQLFAEALRERFELVRVEQVAGGAAPTTESAASGLMTGYATPFVEARLRPDERYRFPLFGDLRKDSPELAVAPRREILSSESARKSVLAWVDDPLLWALVETNGTARLEIDTPSGAKSLLLSRVATNGRPWTGLGRALAARGLVPADGTTLADVAQAARANPAAAEAAAMENERVVFFAAVGSNAFPPALGIAGARLVPGYSCAADQSIYAPGSALLVVDGSPADGRAMPPRLLFVHDAGGAIRGPQRIDAYRGQGTEPLLKAGELREPVTVYRLTRRR